VTLTFDLLTPKVDHFMPLPRGQLMTICIKISLFVFKILFVFTSLVTTNGRATQEHNVSSGHTDLAEV